MVIGMDQDLIESQESLESYSASLSEVIGHADRVEPLGDDCHGLLLPLDRKSTERGCRSGSGFGQAPVSAALRGALAVV